MEAGKEKDIIAQMEGGKDEAQPGTPHGDVVAATGEQGVTPNLPEGTAAQEGQEPEKATAAPEGEVGTEAVPARQEEAPMGETSE